MIPVIEFDNDDMPKTALWTKVAINAAKIARKRHLRDLNMAQVKHYTLMIKRLEKHLGRLEENNA